MTQLETRTEPMVVNFGPHHPSMHGVLRLVVTLDGEERPEQLDLALKFPTDGARDRALVLTHTREGHYVGTLERNLRYRWYLQLQPHAQDASGQQPEWRLTGEAEFPRETSLRLTPGL